MTRNYTITEEERQARSERAKENNRKRAGISRKSAKRDSANEEVARWVKENPQKIIKALKECLTSGSENTRLKAALALLDIEMKNIEAKKKKDFSKMDEDELTKHLAERVRELEAAGVDLSVLRVKKND